MYFEYNRYSQSILERWKVLMLYFLFSLNLFSSVAHANQTTLSFDLLSPILDVVKSDDDYEGYTNVVFDNSSIPNTRTYDNLNSYLSLDINGGISKQISITAKLDYSEIYSMEFIDEDIKIIGNSPDENCIFYIDNNSIINKRCIDEFIAPPHLPPTAWSRRPAQAAVGGRLPGARGVHGRARRRGAATPG